MIQLDVAHLADPTAQALVAALLNADADAVAACFTDGARLRALTPPGLRERTGSAEIGELMASWFADCKDVALVAASAGAVGDRHHVSYRISCVKAGRGPCIIEQQLYLEVASAQYAEVALVCSGFRPVS
jgi:hypothetical protein